MNTIQKSLAVLGTGAAISLGIISNNNSPQPTQTPTRNEEFEVDDTGLAWEDRIEADEDDGMYDYDCSDFRSRREAYSFYRHEGGPYYDPYGLDGDEDGEICENHTF
jgi:hypothetical protein